MRNAFQRSFGARLENTSRAPARLAARSCAVRPELSKTMTSGRNDSIVASTCGVLLVGDASQSMIGKFTDSRNTALRFTRKRMSAVGSAFASSRAMIRQRISSPAPPGPETGENSTRAGGVPAPGTVTRGAAAKPDPLRTAAGAADSTSRYACSMRSAVRSRLNSDRSRFDSPATAA